MVIWKRLWQRPVLPVSKMRLLSVLFVAIIMTEGGSPAAASRDVSEQRGEPTVQALYICRGSESGASQSGYYYSGQRRDYFSSGSRGVPYFAARGRAQLDTRSYRLEIWDHNSGSRVFDAWFYKSASWSRKRGQALDYASVSNHYRGNDQVMTASWRCK